MEKEKNNYKTAKTEKSESILPKEEKTIQQQVSLEKKEGKEIEKGEENQPEKREKKSWASSKKPRERKKNEKELSPLQKEVLATKRVVKVT